ncbi:hypothetical protein JZ751_023950 [Albula glossodonta]|uniref:Uncharacterized protein n=1 Tax=Albula glossodonta TaxID=121402 RepID=A0A8T2NFD8_9TELE|nr:hypothetical protein JZ751_023950 [Albula glossodonta]
MPGVFEVESERDTTKAYQTGARRVGVRAYGGDTGGGGGRTARWLQEEMSGPAFCMGARAAEVNLQSEEKDVQGAKISSPPPPPQSAPPFLLPCHALVKIFRGYALKPWANIDEVETEVVEIEAKLDKARPLARVWKF